jgi:Tfp pilus assembly protein PilZ
MIVDHKIREQLFLSRDLLSETAHQDTATPGPLRLLRDLIVAHGAIELALAAICIQLDCLPNKKDPRLPDYLDSLARAMHVAPDEKEVVYVAELYRALIDSQLRFRLPDPGRWARAKEEALEHIASWCQQFLGLGVLDLESSAAARLDPHVAASEQVRVAEQRGSPAKPAKPRYNCMGSAEIRLASRGQLEKGNIANLSIGGCYVKSELVAGIGDQVEMTLQVNKMSFRVAGFVVHVSARDDGSRRAARECGMGIQFKAMSVGARHRLEDLIAELTTNRMAMRAVK